MRVATKTPSPIATTAPSISTDPFVELPLWPARPVIRAKEVRWEISAERNATSPS